MRPVTLTVLVVLGVGALAGGWYFGVATTPGEQASVDTGRLMFPDLAPRLQQAVRIEIVHQGKPTTIDRKPDGSWGLADRDGYRVQESKLRGMLTGLTELRLVEPRTSDPAAFSRLGLEDPDSPTSNSNLLRVLDASGKPVLAVIVGHRRVRTQGNVPEQVYVRRMGENQAWLAEGNLQVDADPQLWFDRDILNVDHARIARMDATRGGSTIVLTRETDGKLAVASPVDHPKLDDYRIEDVGRALELLSFQDVQSDQQPVGDEVGQASFTTTDGLVIKVRVFHGDKDIWVRFTASGADAVKPEADRLQARLAGWTFQLGTWKEKALLPSLNDLKSGEKPATSGEAASGGSATGGSASEQSAPEAGVPPDASALPVTPPTASPLPPSGRGRP